LKIKYVFIFLFCCFNYLNAQHPVSIHLTEKDGLPDIEFYDIIEDSKQFIWLASAKGLYRYNGEAYTYFTHPKQKGNSVFGLLEDDKGRIWSNNISGQFFFTNGNSIELFIDLGKSLKGELAQFIVTKTHLVVISNTSIFKVSLKDKSITTSPNASKFMVGPALHVEDRYYYTNYNSIVRTDSSFIKQDSITTDIFNYNLISRRINLVSDGNTFLCSFIESNQNVIYQFDENLSFLQEINISKELKNSVINHVFFFEEDIWFATNNGVHIYTLHDAKLKLQKKLFSTISITKTIQDSNDNLWFTTKEDGVYVIPNLNIFEYTLPKSISNIKKIKSIGEHQLILGTSKGDIVDLNTKTNAYQVLDSSSVSSGLSEMINLNASEILITKLDTVFKINRLTGQKKEVGQKLLQGAKSISEVDGIGYVVSTYKDAFLTDYDFNKIRRLIFKRCFANHYSSYNKSIYLSTVDGLYLFDDNFKKIEIKANGKPIYALSITETADHTIWVATFNDGLYRIRNNKVIGSYGINNGLLSNKTGVIQSDANHVWIVTDEGLQLLDTKKESFTTFTLQYGIPTYRITAIEIANNNVFFASNTGVFGISKNNIFKKLKENPIYFTDVRVNDKQLETKDNYTLAHNQNNISFGFNVNGFQTGLNTRYQFRLLGLDSIWKNTKTQVNTVDYNNLPNGKYIFQVKTTSDQANIKTLAFTIEKAFWERWWFYTLVAVFLGFSVFGVFTLKIKKVKKKQAELLQKELINKQLVLSQLENLRSQMNPHFIFNALNSIQEYIVLNEKELASTFLIKFSRLIRIYLEHSKKSYVTIGEELKALRIYLELEKNRFEDLLEYSIQIDDKIDLTNLKIPSLFIQPYVENALKHGLLHKKRNRQLKLKFELNKSIGVLKCSIEDNGIGVKASEQLNKKKRPNHKSFATSANKKRVELLNTNRKNKIEIDIIDLTQDDKTGTKVIITIPLEQ
jgi:ligand-binding sensor domain-containing protein